MRVLGLLDFYPPFSQVGAWIATHELLSRLVNDYNYTVDIATTFSTKSYCVDGVRVLGREYDIKEYDLVIDHAGGVANFNEDSVPKISMVHGLVDSVPDLEYGFYVFPSEFARGAKPGVVCIPPTRDECFSVTPNVDGYVTLINLSKYKGVDLFKRLAFSMPETNFLGVRGGWGKQEIVATTNTKVMGTTSYIKRVYQRTGVLLLPSIETWGRVGVEAMCSGIPVIAHPGSGLDESLSSAGVYCDNKDTQAWAEAIYLLKDPVVYAEQSAICRERFTEIKKLESEGLAALVDRLGELCVS